MMDGMPLANSKPVNPVVNALGPVLYRETEEHVDKGYSSSFVILLFVDNQLSMAALSIWAGTPALSC